MKSDLKIRAAGKAAEEDARWHIERRLRGLQNWIALHDVLLFDKRGDAWCQIDHLVLGRLGHFLVLETKAAQEGMSLDKQSGAFSVWFDGRPKPVKSPIAQNERHIEVLRDFLHEQKALTRFWGIPINPVFRNWILVQPGSRLPPKYDGAYLVQRDQFSKALDKLIDSIGFLDLVRLMSRDRLIRVSKLLEEETCENRRICNIQRESSIKRSQIPSPPTRTLSDEEKYAPKVQALVREKAQSGTMCSSCSVELTFKEAAYCRYNFSKLGHRYLCRKCQ